MPRRSSRALSGPLLLFWSLFSEDLLNLADLLLDLTGNFLVLTFFGHAAVVGDLPSLLFGFALHFVKLARDLVLGAGFHGSPPRTAMSILTATACFLRQRCRHIFARCTPRIAMM